MYHHGPGSGPAPRVTGVAQPGRASGFTSMARTVKVIP